MKSLKLLFSIVFASSVLTSCVVVNESPIIEEAISLEQVVSSHDLWYVDYHRTTGTGDVPFVSKAFTLSFLNGTLYANNNIVDIGRTGNGLGIDVGTYDTYRGYLEVTHDLDGYHDFDIVQLSTNEIRLDFNNVSYYLIGYYVDNFDYDKLFYENIEYFLQEYVAWEKVKTAGGITNSFDNENYLQFTPENNTTFYASVDTFGTLVDNINWDFVGDYQVFDVLDFDDLKILTLNYNNGDTEDFELSVVNDDKVVLYHVETETTYEFLGRGFIQYLKQEGLNKEKVSAVRNSGRKRTKIKRAIKTRKYLK